MIINYTDAMTTKLGIWAESRAELFRYASLLPECAAEAGSILLSGDVSALLAGTMHRLYPGASLCAVTDDEAVLHDAESECNGLMCIAEAFDKYAEYDSFDIVLSLLQIQSLNTRELTPYLFSLYDSLKAGGCIMLSFPEAAAHTVIGKNLFPAWYDDSREVYMKYYMAEDVIHALNLIGFDIRAVERDPIEELYSVVTVIAMKR